jgi:hypothetical protein
LEFALALTWALTEFACKPEIEAKPDETRNSAKTTMATSFLEISVASSVTGED